MVQHLWWNSGLRTSMVLYSIGENAVSASHKWVQKNEYRSKDVNREIHSYTSRNYFRAHITWLKNLTGWTESLHLFFPWEAIMWTQAPSLVNSELVILDAMHPLQVIHHAQLQVIHHAQFLLDNKVNEIYVYINPFSNIVFDLVPKMWIDTLPHTIYQHCIRTHSSCKILHLLHPKSQSFPHTHNLIWKPHICFQVHEFLFCRGVHLCHLFDSREKGYQRLFVFLYRTYLTSCGSFYLQLCGWEWLSLVLPLWQSHVPFCTCALPT